MKTIYKYTIAFNSEGHAQVKMPEFAKILSVGHQGDPSEPLLWAEVDPENATVTRYFQIKGTGHELDEQDGIERHFVGTINFHPTALVWHVYEVSSRDK